MPDVGRSDSQRSDGSLRPRVSFNRDVHVKRIVASDKPQVVGALSGDGAGRLVPTPVRRERAGRLSRQQLAEEAARVLEQADSVNCTTGPSGASPDRFYTLPTRRKNRRNNSASPHSSQERRRSEELGVTSTSPPRKPPRTFATSEKSKSSLLGLFKRPEGSDEEPTKSNLKRSRSDATHLKKREQSSRHRTSSESEETPNSHSTKKQLSPIIEVTQRDDYFTKTTDSNNKENVNTLASPGAKTIPPPRKRWNTSPLSDPVRERNKNNKTLSKPEIVVIDVSEAKDASSKKSSKFSSESFKNKFRSLTSKKDKIKPENKTESRVEAQLEEHHKTDQLDSPHIELGRAPRIEEAIKALKNTENKISEMIHSSQQPADKLPLTKGHKVDNMVKRLSRDKCSPPPKTNIMITPTVTVQHNNNQPFSYTQPREVSPEPVNPVIYAQVVCGGENRSKQTIHTAYTNGKKQLPHSDSDEGLGCEEQPGFSRNYGSDKSFTRFGDEIRDRHKPEDDFPITPKFKTHTSTGFSNGYSYNEYSKTDRSGHVDSSARGRGDGMDSRRRESLTEYSQENGVLTGGRRDLSYRRNQLESRINRRINQSSPEFPSRPYSPTVNKYVSETNSRYYRHGSSSPVGFTDKYTAETKIDRNGEKYFHENRTTSKLNGYAERDEPKSLDSQVSDYRSSPENINGRKSYYASQEQRASQTHRYRSRGDVKERDHYKSNPEIHKRSTDASRYGTETYHDSLRRESSRSHEGRYLEERKDKLGDSGIENDFRRDSGEHVRGGRRSNESEDEGFASSLLIASERQHTEENGGLTRRIRRDYDSDRDVRGRELHDYVHRERSIDDGSHFDPRIDKDAENDARGTLKKMDKKPPKPVKKSGLEKVKQLFSRDSSKKIKKEKENGMLASEEILRARYSEYRGSTDSVDKNHRNGRRNYSNHSQSMEYDSRRRLSTPSPSPTRHTTTTLRRDTPAKTNGHAASWFKSIDRLSRKKNDKIDREIVSDDVTVKPSAPTKNLRFFGDTDVESNSSIRRRPAPRNARERGRSLSSQHLHNISEEYNHSETDRGNRNGLKPPPSPVRRSETLKREEGRPKRKKNEGSSVESSTEGDSSQQSQKSVVYLHAATVGDIPDPGYLTRNGRRAASREELASNGSSRVQQVKTLSRSFSMLAPWKPKHKHEGYEVDYTNYNSKPVKNGKITSKTGAKTAKEISTMKKLSENRKSNQNLSTLNRKSRSKENISQTLNRSRPKEEYKGSSTTLYKKKEKTAKENSRYNRDDRKISNKSMSVESLGGRRQPSSNYTRDEKISRSVSMPRDPDKSAGWFGMKKNKKTVSSQRL